MCLISLSVGLPYLLINWKKKVVMYIRATKKKRLYSKRFLSRNKYSFSFHFIFHFFLFYFCGYFFTFCFMMWTLFLHFVQSGVKGKSAVILDRQDFRTWCGIHISIRSLEIYNPKEDHK